MERKKEGGRERGGEKIELEMDGEIEAEIIREYNEGQSRHNV